MLLVPSFYRNWVTLWSCGRPVAHYVTLPIFSANAYIILSLQKVPMVKIQEKIQILFFKILKNKWYHAKGLLKRFGLNGHTIGFRPQTQKLELHYTSP